MSSPAQPRPAATVLVLRESGDQASVFMVKRTNKASFMAGAYVFPGGRVDEQDRSQAIFARVRDFSAEQAAARLQGHLTAEEALSVHIAALRELFEEAGLLLAVEQDGRPLQIEGDPDRVERFRLARAAVHGGHTAFAEVLEAEGLYLDVGRLYPWAHWLTPEIEAKRFDTWFFVVGEPAGQRALHDDVELTAGDWIEPVWALAQHGDGQFPLAPPTFRTLEELGEVGGVTGILGASGRRRLHAIMPRFMDAPEGMVLLLPGDPEYGVAPGLEYDGPTRIALAQGRWWSRRG